jgi:hypothetical protein
MRSALAFWEGDIEVTRQKEKEDEWYRIRKLFQLWNENMNQCFKAGDTLVCDESMCRWLAENYYGPTVTKMPLKPEGEGSLAKTVACGISSIIFGLELQESPAAMERKELMKTAACTLRLVKPYFAKRCVIADSWFASVTCAVELLKREYFLLALLKGRSCEYPKKYFHESAFTSESIRGETRTLHSTTQYDRLIAHFWYEPGCGKEDEKKKNQGTKK